MKKISRRGAEYAEKTYLSFWRSGSHEVLAFLCDLCASVREFFFFSHRGTEITEKNHNFFSLVFLCVLCASVREFFFFSHRDTEITKKNHNFFGFVFLCVLCASARNLLSPEAQ
jgi:hypothetical protein